jgi:mono/diheme cytochrome c family protein
VAHTCRTLGIFVGLALVVGLARVGRAEDAKSEEFFEKRVRPILAGTCLRCHGDQKQSGGFRLDTRDALLKGGESGPAIDLANADKSRVLLAIGRADDEVSAMPPDKGEALSPAQVADLTAWIKAGAPWPQSVARFESARHWAFQPLRDPAPPAVVDKAWSKTTIDPFILAQLEANKLRPAPPADRRTLIRRVTYDLTGLPPTPAEVAAFEKDASPKAFETVVERLLASPHYGEHWGRHWLDVVRYADTAGENSDHPLPHAWRYRNWVIDAINRDLPYDQFIHEQVAGDLLAKQGPLELASDRIVATGYLAIARRFGHEIDKEMHLTLEDTLDTLGKSVMGLSIGCCRCHDHKFDPLSTRDYYGLYGIFESTKISFTGCEPAQQPRDLVPLPLSAEAAQQTKQIDEQVAGIDNEVQRLTAEQASVVKSAKEAFAAGVTLSEGQIDDAKAAELASGSKVALDKRAIKRGEMLQLAILPRSNHGADSTLVEWEIAELGGQARRWSVADLLTDLAAGNPHADAHGNANTWYFLDLQNGPQLLPEALREISGRRELHAWRNGETPSVFVNTADQPVKVWVELAARSFFVHPGPQGPVGVAWISPIDGEIAIKGRIADAHPSGPDGVGWQLTHQAAADYGRALAALAANRAPLADLAARRATLVARRPVAPVAFAAMEGTPKHARIHKRGEPADLGDEAPRKFLDILGGQKLEGTTTSGRLELAQWLTARSNPLTPRVMANRVWQGHFGRGLVTTPNDFGLRGTAPTHPDLLDHLATSFVRSGWSLKALHRQIVLSATYQQASTGSSMTPQYDSFPRRRLTAEELRDTLLLVSGDLDRVPGQAHPFPPEATWNFTQHAPFAAEYETLKRSVYVMQKRNRRDRFFTLFDGADPNASTPVRDVTTVPTQALFFMNDPFVHARANKLAAQVVAAAATDRDRLDFVYGVLLGRKATDDEQQEATAFLNEYEAAVGDPATGNAQAWNAYVRVLISSNEVLHVD